jgi:hypothetical protein
VCIFIVACGVITVLPIYGAVISSMVGGLSIAHYIGLFTFTGPILVALFQSITCGVLYMLYLPWFLFLAVFFLVYIPSYSYARFFDTTWGNRDTGVDESITKLREDMMRRNVFKFNAALILVNWVLALIFSVYLSSNNLNLIFMLIILSLTLIQILGSVFYLLIVMPFGSYVFPKSSAVKKTDNSS